MNLSKKKLEKKYQIFKETMGITDREENIMKLGFYVFCGISFIYGKEILIDVLAEIIYYVKY